MKLLAYIACVVACVDTDPGDYKGAVVGTGGAAGVFACEANRYEPCGWVYEFAGVERDNPLGVLEMCIIWPDRIGPYPVGLLASAESLYGSSALSSHERFAGTPLCRYHCPTLQGCNAYGGPPERSCFCLDEETP